MNSKVLTNQQEKHPFWLVALLSIVLSFALASMSVLAYKKWFAESTPPVNQTELIEQQQLLLSQTGVINTNWLHTLNPLVKNVEGRIIWSNILQKGMMEFIDLPNIANNQSYQLWIYDLIGKDTKPIFSYEFSQTIPNIMLIPFSAKDLISSPFKFELVLKTEGEELSQPLFLAQP